MNPSSAKIIKRKPISASGPIGEPMRIAICMSGLVRTYRRTLPTHRGAILLAPHVYDTFISTWGMDDSATSTHVIVRKGSHTENEVDFNEINREYRPTMLEFEREFKWPEAIINKYNERKRTDTHAGSVLYMFYKIWAADQLRQRYEKMHGFKYDRVVRTRFDLRFNGVVSYDLENTDINIPPMQYDRCEQFDMPWSNDTLAIGSSDVMSVYCDLFNHIEEMFDAGVPFQAEILLHEWLIKNQIRTRCVPPAPTVLWCDLA